MDMLEPSEKKSNVEAAEPTRAKDRNEQLELIETKSITDTLQATLACKASPFPRLTLLPMRAKLRRLSDEPKATICETESCEPILTKQRADKVRFRRASRLTECLSWTRTKERTDNDDPRWK
jgi:hypothetical protein